MQSHTVVDEPTADILSLSITGGAMNVTIDFTNGDPLPAAGIFSDAANITLAGPHGTDSLITTGSAAMLGNDTIRFTATTQLADNLTGSGGIIALAGSTTFSSVPATADVTVATGATLLFNGSQTLNSLTIEPGGTAREISTVTTLGATALTIGTVTIDDPDTQGDAGGVLDLGNGDLITSNTSLTNIQTWLTAGFDGGLWDAIGATFNEPASIVSSAAAGDPSQLSTLGYAAIGDSAGSLNISEFDGHTVSSGDLVVALTYYGDANLDRVVNNVDLAMIQPTGSGTGTPTWSTGDFNYDGVVDQEDYDLADGSTSFFPSANTGKVIAGKITITSVGLKVNPNGAPPIVLQGSLTSLAGNTVGVSLPKTWTNAVNQRLSTVLGKAFNGFTGNSLGTYKTLTGGDGNLVVGSVDSYVIAQVQVIWVDPSGNIHDYMETVELDLSTASPNGQPWLMPQDLQAMQTAVSTMVANLNLNGASLSSELGKLAVSQWQNGQ